MDSVVDIKKQSKHEVSLEHLEKDNREWVDDLTQLKNRKPVESMVQRCLDLHKQKGAYIAVVEYGQDSAAIVSTRRGYDEHSREVQNIKALLRSKQRTAVQKEFASSPEIIGDYLAFCRSYLDTGGQIDSAAESELNNDALRELDRVVKEALEIGANDIHIRVTPDDTHIQYRVEGRRIGKTNRERKTIEAMVGAALNTRSEDFNEIYNEYSVNSNTIDLNPITYINKKTGEEEQRTVRLRIQKTPNARGFRVTARIQDTGTAKQIPIDGLGLDEDVKALLKEAYHEPRGMILLSGPVGQGKTTTMTAYNEIPIQNNKRVISLEDPIEIIQPEIEQTPCVPGDPVKNFPNMIKVSMREDADILEVSEVRDLETAQATIRAALTGHLVISTTHANNGIGIVMRLIDLGVDARTLSQPGLLRHLTGQRLVPRLCDNCKTKVDKERYANRIPDDYQSDVVYRRNKGGCRECGFTGENGRSMIMEIIRLDKQSREFIANENFDDWQVYLKEQGFLSMADRAWKRVEKGEIDLFTAAERVPDMFKDDTASFSYANYRRSLENNSGGIQ